MTEEEQELWGGGGGERTLGLGLCLLEGWQRDVMGGREGLAQARGVALDEERERE